MKKTGQARKSAPVKPLSRGPGGANATRILCETVDKEERCREKFEKAAMFMKMPRDPINGELTSREDAPFAIPFHHSIMLMMEEQKTVVPEPVSPPKLVRYVDQRETTFARRNPQVEDVQRRLNFVKKPQLDNLRTRAAYMDNEIEQMLRLAEYKKAQLAGNPGGGHILTLPSYTVPN